MRRPEPGSIDCSGSPHRLAYAVPRAGFNPAILTASDRLCSSAMRRFKPCNPDCSGSPHRLAGAAQARRAGEMAVFGWSNNRHALPDSHSSPPGSEGACCPIISWQTIVSGCRAMRLRLCQAAMPSHRAIRLLRPSAFCTYQAPQRHPSSTLPHTQGHICMSFTHSCGFAHSSCRSGMLPRSTLPSVQYGTFQAHPAEPSGTFQAHPAEPSKRTPPPPWPAVRWCGRLDSGTTTITTII
jgi:hypothetical protein